MLATFIAIWRNEDDMSCERGFVLDQYTLAVMAHRGTTEWDFNGDGFHKLKVKSTGGKVPFPEGTLEYTVRTGESWGTPIALPWPSSMGLTDSWHTASPSASASAPADSKQSHQSVRAVRPRWNACCALLGPPSLHARLPGRKTAPQRAGAQRGQPVLLFGEEPRPGVGCFCRFSHLPRSSLRRARRVRWPANLPSASARSVRMRWWRCQSRGFGFACGCSR